MRRIGIAAFTDRGKTLADRIERILRSEYGTDEPGGFQVIRYEKELKQWCRQCFEAADGMIFVGACGIAVRSIAPFLKSKTTDPAVIVLDEKGQFVISLLSGHIGGANEFALTVAEKVGAIPVITTASDVSGKIAVDVFARKNHLTIGSMAAAKKVEAELLRGKRIGVYCSGEIKGELPPELEHADERNPSDCLIWISESIPTEEDRARYLKDVEGEVLHLIPEAVILGVGCRKGKPSQEIRKAVEQVLADKRIPVQSLSLAASIDLKKEEQGILELCHDYDIVFQTYSAGELNDTEGDFQSSEFVRKTTGTDNVCERAARRAAGEGGRLLCRKVSSDGVTVALAVKKWRVCFEK